MGGERCPFRSLHYIQLVKEFIIMTNKTWLALAPVTFFQHAIDCHHVDGDGLKAVARRLTASRYSIPLLAPLCGEEAFADVAMAWSHHGIAIQLSAHVPFRRASYPDVSRGDSLELFIDTRDVKTSGYNTRFCHHFFAFPEPLDGRQAGELTHFRSEEDAHPHCDPNLLEVKALCHKDSYTMTLWLPTLSLVGYDPSSFDRLGFSYRINRTIGPPQHFSTVSREFQIEQQPSLWTTLLLIP